MYPPLNSITVHANANQHIGTLRDIFKTPGKLRGKTPRTARKQAAPGVRQPLTDIFAPNVPAPASAKKTAFFDKVAHFQVSEDAENQPPSHRPASRGKSPQRAGKHINWDSGYHGMTEDEMEADNKTETATQSSQQSVVQKVPLRENQQPPLRVNVGTTDGGTSSDESFTSAREELTARNVASVQQVDQQADSEPAPVEKMDIDEKAAEPAEPLQEPELMDQDQDLEDDPSRSHSGPIEPRETFTTQE